MGDEHRVGHRNGDHVGQPDADDLLALVLGAQQRVVTVERCGALAGHDAFFVRPALAPDRIPAAEIGPGTAVGHDREVLRLFHHRVVDRDRCELGPGLGRQAGEAEIGFRALQRSSDALQHLGVVALEGLDQGGRSEKEDACVPQVHAVGQERLGLGGVGFLDEALERLRHRSEIGTRSLAQLEPAITGFGPLRRNAEGHQLAGFRSRRGGLDGGAEPCSVRDDMVRGRHQHQGAGRARFKRQGTGQDGGRGIACFWFDQGGGGGDLDPGQLLGDDEAEIAAGDHCGRGVAIAREAPGRGLEQALLAGQLGELLGVGLARQGPKPRTGAAAKDEGMNGLGHGKSVLENRARHFSRERRPGCQETSGRCCGHRLPARPGLSSPCPPADPHPSACASCRRVLRDRW